MRALVLSKPGPIESGPLRVANVPTPQPQGDEILIKIKTCGVCHTDLHIIEGELPPVKLPVIPGHQVVGIVEKCGVGANNFKPGDRVGVPWLYQTCGKCEFCLTNRENLCDHPRFTGYHTDGGYAEYLVARAGFTYHLPAKYTDETLAPLLCAGVIGFRAFVKCNLQPNQTIGLYGFGASAHLVLQIARARDIRVFVITRNPLHRQLAESLGAAWVGRAEDNPPAKMDSAIIFAPSGSLVPPALKSLQKGGRLVLAGIYMSDIPLFPYSLVYEERQIISVAHSTRQDVSDFLKVADEIILKVTSEVFSLSEANRVLKLLKDGQINGAAILRI